MEYLEIYHTMQVIITNKFDHTVLHNAAIPLLASILASKGLTLH